MDPPPKGNKQNKIHKPFLSANLLRRPSFSRFTKLYANQLITRVVFAVLSRISVEVSGAITARCPSRLCSSRRRPGRGPAWPRLGPGPGCGRPESAFGRCIMSAAACRLMPQRHACLQVRTDNGLECKRLLC